jgi:hypothetical protein
VLIAIQLESKFLKAKNKFIGFPPADEQIVKILSYYVAMQIERSATRKEVNKKEQQVIDTLQLTSEICTQRDFTGLFNKIRDFMPGYFGFEAVGALLLDLECKFRCTYVFSQYSLFGL